MLENVSAAGMKHTALIWSCIVVALAALVVLLHVAHVLPLEPAPPYKNGDGVWITPSNPWGR
jgi:hypothetical protein